MTEEKNLDEELAKVETIESIDPSTIPEYPMVYDPPKGWPPLIACDGDSWWERATVYERMSGRKVLPLKYVYDENGNIILRSKSKKHDTLKSINAKNAKIYNKGVEDGTK